MYLAILLLSCASLAAAKIGDKTLCKTTEPCENGGICKAFLYDLYCSCPIGFHGARCEIDPCAEDPCQNGGKCIRGFIMAGYTCRCPFGVSGKNCEVHPCSDGPCKNAGTCIPSLSADKYTCLCNDGFSGDTCETLSTACEDRPCQNGGQCKQKGADRRICNCPPNVTGLDCQYSPCASKPCGTGECHAAFAQGHFCKCLDGHVGLSCNGR